MTAQQKSIFHAVVVGVDAYRDKRIPPLTCARSDAKTMAGLFRGRIHADEVNIELLVDEEATRDRVMDMVGEELPRKAGPDDQVFLYFACHGSPERDSPRGQDQPYLILHDTDFDRIYSTGIDMVHTITRWYERLSSRLVVLCLDACFSGASGGRSFCGPLHQKYRDAFNSDEPISLQDLDMGRGRIFLAAAQDHQPALESTEYGHGLFTYYLLRALRQVPSEANEIGIGTLADAVARAVKKETEGEQIPILNGKIEMAALPLLGVDDFV